jgi:hypothetical protein
VRYHSVYAKIVKATGEGVQQANGRLANEHYPDRVVLSALFEAKKAEGLSRFTKSIDD